MRHEMNQNNGFFTGTIETPFVFGFVVPETGKRYFRGTVKITKKNGIANILPVVTEEETAVKEFKKGTTVKIAGNLRTYNFEENGKKKVDIYIFAYRIKPAKQTKPPLNFVMLEGYICKPLVNRTLKAGKKIAVVVIANNRGQGNTNYLPCVFYQKLADKVNSLKIGDFVRVTGRFQSRTYKKQGKQRTAYEVAVISLKTGKKQ